MMRLNVNILAAALGCLLPVCHASAQGSEALPFVRIVRDPVSAGMGFAGAAAASGAAYSSFRNSSVIPFSPERVSLGVSGQSWAPDGEKSSGINLGAAFRTGGRFGFSVGGAFQAGEEYTLTDGTGNAGGTFRPAETVVNAGVGFLIMDNLSAGANVRHASQRLSEDDSWSAVAADMFLTWRLAGLSLTAGVSNVGTSLESVSGDAFSLPSSAAIGADWGKALSEAHGVRLAADADCFFSGSVTAAAGAEYSFRDMLFARAGYHFGTGDATLPSFATVGLGVRLLGVSLDLAYLTANDALGGTITLALGCRF